LLALTSLSSSCFSALQGLHIEDSELVGGLPVAPFLSSLRLLLLDWQAALDSPQALRAATRLTCLQLANHRAVEEGPGPLLVVQPAEAGEPLLAALAAMPALRCIEDFFGGFGHSCMLAWLRRCSCVLLRLAWLATHAGTRPCLGLACTKTARLRVTLLVNAMLPCVVQAARCGCFGLPQERRTL
jgi:hypothetical protein